MPIKPILLFPDPVLVTPSQPIVRFDDSLKAIVRDLHDTLLAGPGVGLAAPQIGVRLRVSVIDIRRSQKHRPSERPREYPLILINPTILEGSGKQIPREGCLSVPDLLANVDRFEKVSVKTRRIDGGEEIIHAHGFEALALQHEIDHLDGRLFLDRVANIKTDVFRRKIIGR